MLLTSSLDPNGIKSTDHYIILHHDDQRDLTKLPETYSDLKKEVEKRYNLGLKLFHIESDELNVCAGRRIKIPEGVWTDVSKLLGNIYIVPSSDNEADSHPEGVPDLPTESPSTLVQTTDLQVIRLDRPFINEELVIVNTGDIKFDAESTPTTKFTVALLDETKNNVLTISIFPLTGSSVFVSAIEDITVTCPLKEHFPLHTDHHIVIYKKESRFRIIFDANLVATVEAPTHAPLNVIAYDLGGAQSPFAGPISPIVLPDLSHLDKFRDQRLAYPPFDKVALYNQVMSCVAGIPQALETVRKEITSCKHSSSGTKWRSQRIPPQKWTQFDWGLQPQTIFVIRYNLKKSASGLWSICFGPKGTKNSLDISMFSTGTVDFWEHTNVGLFTKFHSISLGSNSMHSVGDHSIAFINHGGQLHVIFNFKKSTILPRTTMMSRRPKEMECQLPKDVITFLALDVYDF